MMVFHPHANTHTAQLCAVSQTLWLCTIPSHHAMSMAIIIAAHLRLPIESPRRIDGGQKPRTMKATPPSYQEMGPTAAHVHPYSCEYIRK